MSTNGNEPLMMNYPADKEYNTIEEFYPYFLYQHSNNLNRFFHYTGSLVAFFCLLVGSLTVTLEYIYAAPVIGYGCAFLGHIFIERNVPPTFKYPFKSIVCEYLMLFHFLTGQMSDKLAEYKIQNVTQILGSLE